MPVLFKKLGSFTHRSIIEPCLETLATSTLSDGNEITAETVADADVCIEFSTPDTAFDNIKKLIELDKKVVTGTTGWYDDLNKIKLMVEKKGTGFVYGSNFSIGMNLFFSIIKSAAKQMNKIEDYDLYGLEMHHNKKKDSPSGTAKVLSEIILKNKIGRAHV